MTGLIHGFPASDWITARNDARAILIRRARRPSAQLITYGDLVAQLRLPIEPHDIRVSYLLDEISTTEHAEGRGFLTVLVVHKNGDTLPGNGFFAMARNCGEEFEDNERFHIDAFNTVTRYWRNQPQ